VSEPGAAAPRARPFSDRAGADDFLRGLAGRGAGPLPLAPAALALACRDRPGVDLERYHHHLDALAREVGEAAAGAADIAAQGAALAAIIAGRYGYQGDALTYDDLQNANLMRVIDRRKGLPVALGILYIDAGRAQGWDMAGLAFPGHFLVRIEEAGQRLVLDPFHAGRVRDATGLRELLKAVAGEEAELAPAHYVDVPDRDILLRLQNNLKLRLLESRHFERALEVIDGMTLLAPGEAGLWREAGLVNAELGNLRAAIAALERCLALASGERERHHIAALLQQLKGRLQ
jgi:regulator of sirC expression with transglutaminase-like and TPR domain